MIFAAACSLLVLGGTKHLQYPWNNFSPGENSLNMVLLGIFLTLHTSSLLLTYSLRVIPRTLQGRGGNDGERGHVWFPLVFDKSSPWVQPPNWNSTCPSPGHFFLNFAYFPNFFRLPLIAIQRILKESAVREGWSVGQ